MAANYWQRQYATSEMANNLNAINTHETQAIASLESLLKRTTVPPGGEAHGWIRALTPDDRPPNSAFIVVVDVAAEQFVFKFAEAEL